MGRVISIVGLILIISAGVLTAVSVTYEEQLNAKREIVSKYLKNAEEALKSGDKKEAIKFVKKAIKVDPDSKEPFKFLDKIYQTTAVSTAQKAESTTATPVKSEPQKPQASEEEEEDLGC
jgi:Tfp pilus assembly protein PilF